MSHLIFANLAEAGCDRAALTDGVTDARPAGQGHIRAALENGQGNGIERALRLQGRFFRQCSYPGLDDFRAALAQGGGGGWWGTWDRWLRTSEKRCEHLKQGSE